MNRLLLLVFCFTGLTAFADEPELSKILKIKSYPFHTNAHHDAAFAAALENKNLKTIELIEKLIAAAGRKETTREFFTQLAFAETLDCGGACFSFVPYSSEVSRVEVSLCGTGPESMCQATLHSYSGKNLILKGDLERAFGRSGDCLSFTMDTTLLHCPLDRVIKGTAADVTVFWVKNPAASDESINEIHLRMQPHTVAAVTEKPQPQPPGQPASERIQATPAKPADYNPLSTPSAKLYFVGVIVYLIAPLLLFYYWRNKRLKGKKPAINPIFSGSIGFILNLVISYYGTRMWAEGKQFYDMGGIALIFVFLFIFIIAAPVTVIVTQILADFRAK